MKAAFILIFYLAIALAQPGGTPYKAWADSTANFPTWQQPNSSSSSGCAPVVATSASNYAVMNFTVPTAGVYEIVAIGDANDFSIGVSPLPVYIYEGAFDPTKPCSNYIRKLVSQVADLTVTSTVDDFVPLQPGTTYFVVVTGTPGKKGSFAVQVFAPQATGNITSSDPAWDPIDYSSGCSTPLYDTYPYNVYFWTQSTSGVFDIIVGFDGSAQATGILARGMAVLYEGAVESSQISNIPSSATCSSIGAVGGWRGYNSGIGIYGQSLTAGQNYSLVFSWAEAAYGIQVVPTRLVYINSTVGYTQPSRIDDDCQPDSDFSNFPWVASTFSTSGNLVLFGWYGFSTANNFALYDDGLYAFYYNGTNVGTASAAPSTCINFFGSDMPLPSLGIYVKPGSTTTVVLSPAFSQGASDVAANSAGLWYVMTGSSINGDGTPPTSTGSGSDSGSGSNTSSGATLSGMGIVASMVIAVFLL